MSRSTEDIRMRLTALIPRLRRFACARTGNQSDGDDLVQMTLERAILKQHQFEAGTRLEAWVFRIANNIWIDEVRARGRRADPTDPGDLVDVQVLDGAASAEAKAQLAQTRRAMAQLPDEQRAVLALVAIEGLSYKEAAEALDVPVGTIMSRLARGRKALVEALGDDAE